MTSCWHYNTSGVDILYVWWVRSALWSLYVCPVGCQMSYQTRLTSALPFNQTPLYLSHNSCSLLIEVPAVPLLIRKLDDLDEILHNAEARERHRVPRRIRNRPIYVTTCNANVWRPSLFAAACCSLINCSGVGRVEWLSFDLCGSLVATPRILHW